MDQTKNGKLIFLIDDDLVSNYLNLRLLGKLQIIREVRVFQNAKEALDSLILLDKNKEKIPDLIIIDLGLLFKDEFDFKEAFKELPLLNKEIIKIVFISISGTLNDLEKRFLGGFDLYEKPLTLQKVNKMLNYS